MDAINFKCIPFNQSFVIWIVSSIITTLILAILNIILPKKIKKYPIIAIGVIDSLKGIVLLLWAILSWAKFWKFSEPCTEYIPIPWFNKKFN